MSKLFFTMTAFLVAWRLTAQVPMDEPMNESVAESVATTSPGTRETLAFEEIARFTLALEQIHQRYLEAGEEVDYDDLIDGAIAGMMSKLDGYSDYMEGDSLKWLEETTRGRFGGVGVVINQEGDWITVVSPIEDSPGWEAGLLAGDQFVTIDGQSARGIGITGAVEKLRGEPGTDVDVRVRRPSENRIFEVTLTRSIIENPSVNEHRILEDGIGYLRVKTFTETTAQLLRRELTALNRKNVKRLVLDLRGNPGGLLDSAVEVAGLFLPLDTLVVYTRGRDESQRKEYRTTLPPHRLNPELVVLVNRGSASASEIVSGALQDYGRAVLVGQTTFGKASVQSIVPLPDGSALKLTTASYHTPHDREIHEKGIEPDERVEFSPRQWMQIQTGMREATDWEADPQLMRAVELLQGREDAADENEEDHGGN
ncbi:MAG: S41 family peptidase [Kiritimatiellia bacterium]